MRNETTKTKIYEFFNALGASVGGPGKIYLTGGSTALLYGWRETTVDIDLKPDPEPVRFFESIAELKEKLNVNLELASPDQFIPELPGWRDRSRFIGRYGKIDFYHYDFYAQALCKLERGHARDITDVEAMLKEGLIEKNQLAELFQAIYSELIRYPAIDEITYAGVVEQFCQND